MFISSLCFIMLSALTFDDPCGQNTSLSDSQTRAVMLTKPVLIPIEYTLRCSVGL